MEPNSGSGFSNPPNQETPKFLIENGQSLTEASKPLPETYGDNKLVIMARDPLWFFAYWEATADRLFTLRDQVGQDLWQKGQAVLRVYDMTGVAGSISEAKRFFDVTISFDARRWYVHVPDAGRSWVVELGFCFPDGRFLALLRSNRIGLPQGRVSDQTDSRWMIVNVQEWQKMFESVDPFSHAGGSAEITKMMAQRWEFLRSVYSGSSSRLSSSRAPAVITASDGETPR